MGIYVHLVTTAHRLLKSMHVDLGRIVTTCLLPMILIVGWGFIARIPVMSIIVANLSARTVHPDRSKIILVPRGHIVWIRQLS